MEQIDQKHSKKSSIHYPDFEKIKIKKDVQETPEEELERE